MDIQDFLRSKALNNIPQKKLQEYLSLIEGSDEDIQKKNIRNIAINRYYESNIPVEYWFLKMEKDFEGDPRLLEKYNEYITDLKTMYLKGKSICFAGQHGVGKQLSLNTELPTPNGFVKLIDLKEGDQLFDEQGNICNVLKLHPIDISPKSYKIYFNDYTYVEACADHLWLILKESETNYKLKPSIRTTKQIFDIFEKDNKKYGEFPSPINYFIQCTKPVNYQEKNLPIDPYILGLFLGYSGKFIDYNYKLDNDIDSILNKVNSKFTIIEYIDLIKKELLSLNLLNVNDRFIPNEYLYSSYNQRLSLIKGLIDSLSLIEENNITLYFLSKKLFDNINQLLNSLGVITYVKVSSFSYKYEIFFKTNLPLLEEEINNSIEDNNFIENRLICDIHEIDSIPMRCITVDSPSNLFLITRSFIPTHNTMTSTCILKKASQKGFSCLYTTLSDVVNTLIQANGEERFTARKELTIIDFLVIDEFDSRFIGSDNAADLYARSLETIFRTRSQNKLPTLMCTNSPNVVETFGGTLKQSLGSLFKGYLEIFPVFGEDFRKRGK